MKKLYTSPKAEIVNYSTPDVVQIGQSNILNFNNSPEAAANVTIQYSAIHK